MPDALRELIAEGKRLKNELENGDYEYLQPAAKLLLAALPRLQSLLPLVDDMQGTIKRALRTLLTDSLCGIELHDYRDTDLLAEKVARYITAELMAPTKEVEK